MRTQTQTQQTSQSWWIGQPPLRFTDYVERHHLPRMRLSKEAAQVEPARMADLRDGQKRGRVVTRWRES